MPVFTIFLALQVACSDCQAVSFKFSETARATVRLPMRQVNHVTVDKTPKPWLRRLAYNPHGWLA